MEKAAILTDGGFFLEIKKIYYNLKTNYQTKYSAGLHIAKL